MSIRNKRGQFTISGRLLQTEKDWDILYEAIKHVKFVAFDVRTNHLENTITFTGISEYFEELLEGEIIRRYNLEITVDKSMNRNFHTANFRSTE